MKRLLTFLIFSICLSPLVSIRAEYRPTEENMESRRRFDEDRFGIFIHWGIYSMFAQGEWYLNNGNFTAAEYAKAASGFYPSRFNAREWADAIKASGARYICFTSRHHDGFSMFKSEASPYNIVDATPFGRDILKELSEACADKGLSLHLYYSHLDWSRDDYPKGRTGPKEGRDTTASDWNGYYAFMNGQLCELLSNYGPIRAIWFDGWWDHEEDETPFDWQLEEQYNLIHTLQPSCLVGNNHHQNVFPGEDIQIFERDVPGENTAGYSTQSISRLPLETCQTMNGMWGYKITDSDYKDSGELIRLLVRTAGKGANLLLNIGPQPNGELPEAALLRLAQIGEWMRVYGETIYGSAGSPFEEQEWGTATVKDGKIYLHVLNAADGTIRVPLTDGVSNAVLFRDRRPLNVSFDDDGVTISLDGLSPEEPDCVIELS